MKGRRGRELFARSGLAGDEHRARRARDDLQQLKQVAHHAAAPDKPIDPISLLQLRAQVVVLGFQPALFHRGRQHVEERVELKGLGDEVGGALLDRVDGVLDRSVARDHDRHDVGIALERGIEDLPSVDTGKSQICNQDVEGEVGDSLDRVFAAAGLLDDEAMIREALGDRLTQRLFVVYDQQMFRRFRHLLGLAVF